MGCCISSNDDITIEPIDSPSGDDVSECTTVLPYNSSDVIRRQVSRGLGVMHTFEIYQLNNKWSKSTESDRYSSQSVLGAIHEEGEQEKASQYSTSDNVHGIPN